MKSFLLLLAVPAQLGLLDVLLVALAALERQRDAVLELLVVEAPADKVDSLYRN